MHTFRKSFKWVTARRVTYGACACGGVVLAQAAYLQRTYVPIRPPKEADAYGVIRFTGNPNSSTGEIVRRESHSSGTNALIPHLMRRSGETAPHRNVLIIGDSLVVGIGCKDKPILPQALCRQMAQLLKVDISWRSLGVNGADVRTIHKNVLEAVRAVKIENQRKMDEAEATAKGGAELTRNETRKRFPKEEILEHLQQWQVVRAGSELVNFARARLSSHGSALPLRSSPPPPPSPSIDAVVVMVGLNDFKKIFFGRTSSVFRRDLDLFLTDLRAEVGDQCVVVLPAIPLEETTLPEPVKSIMILLCNTFDSEKRKTATQQALVHFIPKPAIEIWQRAKDRYGNIVARDGVHPNEAGYTAFAEYLGQELAGLLKQQIREGEMAGRLPGTALCQEETLARVQVE
mmetsp:Transcript_51184/g.120283  ORF Transcript_51184/g.120283 Transcript_51184/m.120283 type:complete len:403 (-) Transcript_51184:473-1681(-)